MSHPALRHATRRAVQLHHRDGLSMRDARFMAGARDVRTLGKAPWLEPHADLDDLRQHGEALCRAIATELADRPFYVLWIGRDLPPDHQAAMANVEGWWSRPLSLYAKDRLAADGRWRGAGPAVAISDQHVSQARDAADAIEVERSLFYSTALHEFSHSVVCGFAYTPEGRLPNVEHACQLAAATLASPLPSPTRDAPPYTSHGALFMRAASHISYRAELFGLPGFSSYAGHLYELSPAWRYDETLADECTAMRRRPFDAILDSPPPLAFVELWESDVRRWYDEHPAKTPSDSVPVPA